VTVQLPSGKTLTISAPNASDSNRYIQSMTVNGQAWNAAYLPPSVLAKGGAIVENLGGSPNTAWASDVGAAPPSTSTGELPGIGFTMPSGLIPANPGGAPVTLGVQNVTDQLLSGIGWTATATPGVTVTPSHGTIAAVPACSWTSPSPESSAVPSRCGSATTSVSVSTAGTTNQGTVTFRLTTAAGTQLPPLVDRIGCVSGPQPGISTCGSGGAGCSATTPDPPSPDNLAPYYNNPGISDDCTRAGDYDQEADSYSTQALAAAGIFPGKDVLWNGFVFQWPDVAPGLPNDVMFAGQTIPLSVPSGATALGFLGSASNGPISENVLVTYQDGSQQSEPLCFDDWTLGGTNAGASAMTCAGDGLVAATGYRNTVLGQDAHLTDVFGAQIPLDPAKTPVTITLPPSEASGSIGVGQIHLFAMSADTLPLAQLP
jgi:hypothetical protein